MSQYTQSQRQQRSRRNISLESKFIRANHEFLTDIKIEFTLLKAELESLKNKEKVVTQSTTTQNSGYKQYQQ